MKKRRPCPTCPWRASTPKRGFPGGIVDAARLLDMASGEMGRSSTVMQCHCTPDGPEAKVCVGFGLVVGADSVALRLAVLFGRVDPDEWEADGKLLTLDQVLRKHGGRPG